MADGSVIIDTELDQSGLKNGLSGLAGNALKGMTAAITAAGAAVVATAKQSVEAYANYEQLVGGVETLFKESADIVQEYADKAYETAGLSANAYMETVTSFSASLLQSLGGDTEAAAEKANMAITDMADNANKMGTDMSAIQNAYQGFAKQNYTMLDNLKLGYGGTKQEMQRLLETANQINAEQGIITDYQIDSYADIVDAIHVVQTEMGITGTTAKEASSTIQGSAAAMKSAWQNVLVGIADENADFDGYLDAFVESVATFGENIIPRVTEIIGGIGKLVEELAPIIADALPGIVEQVLPSLLDAASSLVTGFIDAIVGLLPTIVECAGTVILSLLEGLVEAAPQIVEGAAAAIGAFIDFVTENLPQIIEMGIELTAELAVGIIKAIPQLVAKLPQLITAIVNGIKAGIVKIVEVGKGIVDGVWSGIQAKAAEFTQKVKNFFTRIVNSVKSALGIASPSKVFRDVIGKMIPLGVAKGIEAEEDAPVKATTSATKRVIDAAKYAMADYDQIIEQMRNDVEREKAQEAANMGTIASANVSHYDREEDDTDGGYNPEDNDKPKYVENNIQVNGKTVARVLTPYVEKELEWRENK